MKSARHEAVLNIVKNEKIETQEVLTARLRELGFTDFDRAFALAVKGEADYCREQGYPIHPSTLELLKIID